MTDAGVDSGVDAGVMSPRDVCLASLTAQCMRHSVCQGGDVASCVALEAPYCPGYYFGPASNRTVENVQACLPALAAMTCTDIEMEVIPSCLLPGKGGPGDACVFASQCQSGCVDGFDQCGTCSTSTLAATGAACGSQAKTFCAATDFCHPLKQQCAPKSSIVYADQGQPCDFDADPVVGCKGDLICARPSASKTQGTCQPVPQLGEPCGYTGDVLGLTACGPGLACDTTGSMTCQPPVLDCGGVTCDATSSCRSSGGDAGSTCVPLVTEGAACNLGTGAAPEVRCASGLYCRGASLTAPDGVCGKPGALGEACDLTHFCASDLQCSSDTGQCITFDPAACLTAGIGPDASADSAP